MNAEKIPSTTTVTFVSTRRPIIQGAVPISTVRCHDVTPILYWIYETIQEIVTFQFGLLYHHLKLLNIAYCRDMLWPRRPSWHPLKVSLAPLQMFNFSGFLKNKKSSPMLLYIEIITISKLFLL